jgi:probable phosphomutase (TIGR03848 family)
VSVVILLRHGQSTANVAGILAGRSPDVFLNEKGLEQAEAVAARLSGITLDAVVSSPMERCRQTVAPLAAAAGLTVRIEPRIAEVDYGEWTGRELKDLGGEKLWQTVQSHPSAAVFPGGEGLAQVSVRAVGAIRDLCDELGPDSVILVCSHGDVIKAVLADALGLHLDGFQRIVVAPSSLSVIRYTPMRPFVERVNDSGELGSLRPPPKPTPSPGAGTNSSDGPRVQGTSGGRHQAGPDTSSDAVPGGIAG